VRRHSLAAAGARPAGMIVGPKLIDRSIKAV